MILVSSDSAAGSLPDSWLGISALSPWKRPSISFTPPTRVPYRFRPRTVPSARFMLALPLAELTSAFSLLPEALKSRSMEKMPLARSLSRAMATTGCSCMLDTFCLKLMRGVLPDTSRRPLALKPPCRVSPEALVRRSTPSLASTLKTMLLAWMVS